jgi:hypothetical protein
VTRTFSENQSPWPHSKVAIVGYLTGAGATATQICEELNDGTHPGTVRKLWQRWKLPLVDTGGRRKVPVPIGLTAIQRSVLRSHAQAEGIVSEEWLRRIAECAIQDGLYAAITDGKYEK